MYDRKEHKMCPIGQALCQVMELLMTVEQVQRLEIVYDGAVCGYLTVRAWRVSHQSMAGLGGKSGNSG